MSETPLFRNYFPQPKNVVELLNAFFDAQFYIASKESETFFFSYLEKELNSICTHLQDCNVAALHQQIRNEIQNIRATLLLDAQFIVDSDPASASLEEVILCYPGFYAIAVYRFAHILQELRIPLISRMMSEHAHSKTGIDIHPSAQIGSPFFIDHGTGIVIGETSIIGNRVKMYQGVTLGALQVNKCDATSKRHPTIQDDVIMYSNCCVLGGETVIGQSSIIGANTFITKSIPVASKVYTRSTIEFKKDRYELMYEL